MITIQDLIIDEEQAIEAYKKFLSQAPHDKQTIFKIHFIIKQEQNHIKILRKLK